MTHFGVFFFSVCLGLCVFVVIPEACYSNQEEGSGSQFPSFTGTGRSTLVLPLCHFGDYGCILSAV